MKFNFYAGACRAIGVLALIAVTSQNVNDFWFYALMIGGVFFLSMSAT